MTILTSFSAKARETEYEDIFFVETRGNVKWTGRRVAERPENERTKVLRVVKVINTQFRNTVTDCTCVNLYY